MPGLTAAWWRRSGPFTYRFWTRRSGSTEPGSAATRIVLFSDPDTLRDEGTTGWAQTRTAIQALEDQGVAVVLWGNETRSQMEVIQRDLDLHHPFISETGAGLFVPHGYFRDRLVGGRVGPNYRIVDFGKPYDQVVEALHDVARKVGTNIIAFSDMSIHDVAQSCDLSLSQARLAKLREYDEPFRVIDSEPATYSRLCSSLRRLDLRCFTHETFHHATGVTSKTQSLRLLASLYRHASSDAHVLTIGLAKARSESALLQCVDVPVVVQGDTAGCSRLGRKVPTARFANAAGPQGWCEAILQLIVAYRRAR
jgi:mannosyl-3-phosphoglycerate phosphatase